MAERDTIKMAALHIYGEASDWWLHGIKILCHDEVFTYEEFTLILTKRFDQRDPVISIYELAHVKQVGTLESYIYEFQREKVMRIDISEARFILFFTEGLKEFLKGLMKSYRPRTLQEVVRRTKYLPKMQFRGPTILACHPCPLNFRIKYLL